MIKCDNLTKTYGKNESLVTALSDCSLDISQGEFVAIMGKSGAGKSTLQNILCGIISSTSGRYFQVTQSLLYGFFPQKNLPYGRFLLETESKFKN